MNDENNNEKTVGDLISEIIDKKSQKMNNFFTNMFIYGPELFKTPVKDIEEKIKEYLDKNDNEEAEKN